MQSIIQTTISINQPPTFITIALAMLSVAKFKTCLQLRRLKKQFLQQWLTLQHNTKLQITLLKQLTSKIPSLTLLTEGIIEIQQISDKVTQILKIKLDGFNLLISGQQIIDMCIWYQGYKLYTKSYLNKLQILKNIKKSLKQQQYYYQFNKKVRQNYNNKILININDLIEFQSILQKILFRSFQISLLINKYTKLLKKSIPQLPIASQLLKKINEQFDKLIKYQQKLTEIKRIQKQYGKQINSDFIYTQQCQTFYGKTFIHIFKKIILIEWRKMFKKYQVDVYCYVQLKKLRDRFIVLLLIQAQPLQFILKNQKNAIKLNKTLNSIIILSKIKGQQFYNYEKYQPWLIASVTNVRQQIDLNKQKYTCIKVKYTTMYYQKEIISDQKQDYLFKTAYLQDPEGKDIYDQSQNKQFHQIITYTLKELQQILYICKQYYQIDYLAVKNYNQLFKNYRIKQKQKQKYQLILLQQNFILNIILRHKNILSNPIMMFKQLKISQIMFQIRRYDLNNIICSCKICQKFTMKSIKNYLNKRLKILWNKHKKDDKMYCSNLFYKARVQINKVRYMKRGNCQQLAVWRYLKNGSLDYVFKSKSVHVENINYEVAIESIENGSVIVEINEYTIAAQIIDQIGLHFQIPYMIGYRLFLHYSNQDHIFSPNQLIIPFIQKYNVRKHKPSKFFSLVKNFFDFFENGYLILKKVLFCPLNSLKLKQLNYEILGYKFKYNQFIGLTHKSELQLIILFALRYNKKQTGKMPQKIYTKFYEPWVPNSLQFQIEDYINQLDQIYQRFQVKSLQQIIIEIEERLKISIVYEKFVKKVKIVQIKLNKQELVGQNNIKRAFLAIGWNGLSLISQSGVNIVDFNLLQGQLKLQENYLQITGNNGQIIIDCSCIYEFYQICRQYQQLKKAYQQIQ